MDTNQPAGRIAFPSDFVWGVATSSYQIEGAANEDGRSPSIWDTFAARPGAILDGTTGAVACDHYHRYREDIALIRQLGASAYRFSISWPRVLPEGTGRVNEDGLAFYDRLVDTLLDNEIEPFATLYHWDMPQIQHDKTPWTDRRVVDAFVEYADVMTRALGDRVKKWMTINEPWVVSFLGYGAGTNAPGIADRDQFLQAAHHVLLAHGAAVPVIRANGDANTQVGIVINLSYSDPASDRLEDVAAQRRWDGFFNRWYLDPVFKGRYPDDMLDWYGRDSFRIEPGDLATISVPTDFLAINYYSRNVIKALPSGQPPAFEWAPFARLLETEEAMRPGEFTDMNWEVYPDGLYKLLARLREEYTNGPIYVTENGAAYDDEVIDGQVNDPQRLSYLERHFAAAHRAIQEGVPLKGYFVWSLLDNFEWAFGYSKRFGIVYVDYETQERIPKASARWYSQVTRENGFAPQVAAVSG